MASWGVVLVVARLWGILVPQVLWRTLVGPLWWVLAAGLAIALAPLVPVGALPAKDVLVWIVLELGLGAVIGLLVALPGHALVGAGMTHSAALGLGIVRSRALVVLVVALVLGFGLSLHLHRPLIAALLATFDRFPVGRWAATGLDPSATAVAIAAHEMTILALALATPVLLTVAVVDVVTRLVGSGPAPAEAIAGSVRPWLRAALALCALGASWAAYPLAWARALGHP